MSETPTTDQFGHRVPTNEEMDECFESTSERAVEAEMRERLMSYHNQR